MKAKVEVVISGAAGAFPECNNILELEDALFKKVHLVTNDDRKWKETVGYPGHCGKAFTHEKFDPLFFKVPFSSPTTMDPLAKKCLETSVEAIIDAGVNPKSLAGTRTAVYAVYDFSEFEMSTPYAQSQRALLGVARTFTANRLSFTLNLKGPSFTALGGYGQTFHFIDEARAQLEEGEIDAAVIVTANYILSPRSLAILHGMGLAANDGKCSSFDQNAHGYALSEGCVAFFLQRASEARRNWATVIGAEYRFFGTKEGNVLAFDGGPAKEMLRQLYSKWNVDPADVGYIEADGCGIKDRDTEEANIISDVFCRKRRKPLLIGSVKSNVGHAEAAACAIGAVKAIIALKNTKIPPNININSPLPELTSRGIKVVTESTIYDGDLIGVNTIGLTGHFGHLLLRANPRKSSTTVIEETLPQIILLSSRTESGMEDIMTRVRKTKITPEFASLANGVFSQEIQNHMYRGYGIVSSDSANVTIKSQRADGDQRPIWWVFSGMGSQWNTMGSQLMHIPIFRDTIDRCDKVLAPHGVDVKYIITTEDKDIFDNILNAFVGITAVQIGLTEILRALKLEPAGMVGHSVGELGCAYADGCLTLEQTILAAHARGKASREATLIKGMMAAIGMSYGDIVKQLPESIDVACRNSNSSCTISGPAADVEKFVSELTSQKVFARSVNVANIAYHSRYIQPAAPVLLKYLKEVIPENTARSEKWISSSIPKENWGSELATYSSPEYHTNNLLSPVLFEDTIKSIPSNAILIEIAPHGLLQAILKRAMPKKVTNVPLTLRSSPDGVTFLLEAIGQLYLLGCKLDVSALYPPVQFPVPQDTPSLQPFVTWDHSETYGLPSYMTHEHKSTSAISEKCYSVKDIKNLLKIYKKNDTPISCLSFILTEVWKIFGAIEKQEFKSLPVAIDNIQIYSEPHLSVEGSSQVWIQILRGSGEFIVFQDFLDDKPNELTNDEPETSSANQEVVLMTGRIRIWERGSQRDKFPTNNEIHPTLNGDDSYGRFLDFLESAGGLQAKSITDIHTCSKGLLGKIKINSDWTIYLDTLLNLNTMWNAKATEQLPRPASIQSIQLDPELVEKLQKVPDVEFFMNTAVNSLQCIGVTINGFKTVPIPKPVEKLEDVHAERLYFVPYGSSAFKSLHEFWRASFQIMVGNSGRSQNKFKIALDFKVSDTRNGKSAPSASEVLTDFLQASNDLNVEIVPAHTYKNGTKCGVHLSYISGPQCLSQLSLQGGSDDTFFLVAVPVETQIKNGSNTISNYGKDYAVLYEQVFGSFRYGLLKKKISGRKTKVYHVSENVLSTLNALKSEVKTGEEQLVFVVSKTCTSPEAMIRKILREAGTRNFKFFFLLDNNAPPFSLDESIYREQLERDVLMNVLKNGKWGSYHGVPISKLVPANVAQILPHVNQVSEEVNIRYIGLNPTSSQNMTQGSPAILDYSGVTPAGVHVVGIAYKNEGFKNNICLDSIFQWTVPKNLPLDEAASLPTAYLMAHSIMEERMAVRIVNDTDGTMKKTAFIINGQSPIGLAFISLCIEKNYDIYTTVSNETAAQLVSQIFPQIPKSNITNDNSEDFYVPMMFGTNGVGPDIIVSDAPRKQMLTAWTCIGKHGSFVNLNEETMQHNAPLPMGRFSKDTGYYGFKLSQLVQLPKERKIRLHALVSESLSSGQMVHMPHKSVDVNDLSQLSRTVEMVTEQGGKLLLDVGSNYKGKKVKTPASDFNCVSQSEWITPKDSQLSSVIISSSVGRVVNLVEWLLERGVKNIVLSTSDANDNREAVRAINNATSRHEATLLMTSAKAAHTPAGVENILNQAKRLGEISTIFTVAMDTKDSILPVIQKYMKNFLNNYTLINIQGETWTHEIKNMVTIICDDDVSYCGVLSQALTDHNKPATYVVSSRSSCTRNESVVGVKESMTDYLPSSLQELEEIGESLSHWDSRLSSQIPATFIQTTSLATNMPYKHGDVLPVFIIPAFCETQLRPLLSKFMYPCYSAHTRPEANSPQQIAEHLFSSMTKIQTKGPYTIVAETWSGGVAMLLANLLSDFDREVSLFLLQGFPRKMYSLLPQEKSIADCLLEVLLELIEKDTPSKTKDLNGTRGIETAMQLISNKFNRSFVTRALQTIERNLELVKSLSNRKISLQSALVLMEVSQICKLTSDEVEEVSKNFQLVKIDCGNHKEMISHPRTAKLIAEKAPFSW
ncbi:unnamed protein product [Bemisia tabaci]|uniref:Ketosynthase family 3 (KS3) domain-containing protein n=1 Tax=Bemisia tabaci TaxID=7038 RepID=A0A9P0ANV9_BEMTA|nr:unnamed protein product [Bemisia tabaci]